jgi:hypothetical protein
MYLKIMFRVRAQLVSFHATTLYHPSLRLQGEGFPPSPRETLIKGVKAQKPDILFFTADQIYEIKPTPRDKSDRFPVLDYLYKWYLWCWSFGELTREIPCSCQMDDHDVYQGNVWDWSGRLNMASFNDGGGMNWTPNV